MSPINAKCGNVFEDTTTTLQRQVSPSTTSYELSNEHNHASDDTFPLARVKIARLKSK